jgi:O-antigen/teichoic acid export membrane protein
VLTRIGWLILLPVYWTRLNPEDFGIIGISYVVQLVLGPLLSLGLYDAVLRFYLQWHSDERPRRIAALWVLAMAWGAVVSTALLLAGSALFGWIFVQVPFYPYLELAVGTAFFSNIANFPLAILRIKEQAVRYALTTTGIFATQTIFMLWLVLVLDEGVVGYLLGMMLASAIWGMYFVWRMTFEVSYPFRWQDAREPIRYALPTIPVAILEGTNSIFDRYFLDKYTGIAQIGFYSLANNFGMALNAFNQILKTSWVPFLYRVDAETNEGPAVLGRFSVYYLAFMAVPALAIAILAREYIEWFGGPRYAGIYPLVPWFVLTYYVSSVATAMGRGLDLAKKTQYWLAVSVIGITISLVGLSILVPRYGAHGAIAAILIATTARTGLQIWLAQYFYPRPFHGFALLRMAMASVATFVVGYNVNFGHTGIDAIAKALTLLIGAVAIVWSAFGTAGSLRLMTQLIALGRGKDGVHEQEPAESDAAGARRRQP